MKKILTSLLCAALVLSFASCVPNEIKTISTSKTAESLTPSVSAETSQKVDGEEFNALTGLPLEVGAEPLRPVAVLVDNLRYSWPSSGLSKADIVFETVVWEDITRFTALYSDYNELPVVGPVRELHMPLLQCVFSAQPIFVTDAISVPCEQFLKKNAYMPYIFDSRYGQNAVWDNEKRLAAGMPVERTRYTDGGNLGGAIKVYGTDMQPNGGTLGFSFSAEDIAPVADAALAENVQISFTETNMTLLSFDIASKQYRMAQYDKDDDFFATTIDENTRSQLGFDNVLVLFADASQRKDIGNDLYHDSFEVDFEKGGEGYYCYGGNSVAIDWQKGTAAQPFQLGVSGNELKIHPGTTYVAIVYKGQNTGVLFN